MTQTRKMPYKFDDMNGNLTAEQDGAFVEEAQKGDAGIRNIGNGAYYVEGAWGLNENGAMGGNNTANSRRDYRWDERNRLSESADVRYSVKYTYGPDGERTNKYAVSRAGGIESETLYFNRMWNWRYDGLLSDRTGTNSKHIFLGDTRILTKVVSADSFIPSAERVRQYYYHSDHLGSAQLITDYRGEEYERLEYTPYGELWIEKASAVSVLDIPYRFTGKERDSETGLYYYGARYLDSKTSRWLSGDPAVSDYIPSAPVDDEARKQNKNLPGIGGVFNTTNLHTYNYSLNNPVRYTDPDGEVPFLVVTGAIGAVAGAGISIATDVAAGRDINWGRAGGAAAAGALVGLTLGAVAATAATATAVSVGNAAASFSAVTGYGAATATVATTSALPLGSEVSKQYSKVLTSSQLSNVTTVAEISHNLTVRKTLSGTVMDQGHIEKIKNNVVGLQKALVSIQGSLQNKNLSQEARTILLTAQDEATKLIQRGTELLESVK